MGGVEFWELYYELLRSMIVGLKNQYPEVTFDEIRECLMGIGANHRDREK